VAFQTKKLFCAFCLLKSAVHAYNSNPSKIIKHQHAITNVWLKTAYDSM